MTDRGASPDGGAARPVAPRAASWLLLALTALAALVGVGLEPAARTSSAVTAALADGTLREAAGPGPRGERLTQLPAPTVAGAAGTSSGGSGPSTDVALSDGPPLGGRLLPVERPVAVPAGSARAVDGRGGRAPPLTTGT